MTHKIRNQVNQVTHDKIISTLVKILEKEGKKTLSNPNGFKKHGVVRGDLKYWPDVYVYKGGTVTEIYEVETAGTCTESEVKQWLKYSKGGSKFFLVVPKDCLVKVKKLASKSKIKVDGYLTF